MVGSGMYLTMWNVQVHCSRPLPDTTKFAGGLTYQIPD